MKVIEEINFFFKESKSYMSGYSKKYYYSRLLKAFIRFMYFTIKTDIQKLWIERKPYNPPLGFYKKASIWNKIVWKIKKVIKLLFK